MTFKDYLKQGFTGIATLISSFTCLVTIIEFEPEGTLVSAVIAGASGYGFKYFRGNYLKRVKHSEEKKLLELFNYQRHALSVAQVALMTSMPVDTIQDRMDELQRKGVMEIIVTETGAILYQLPETSGVPYLGGF